MLVFSKKALNVSFESLRIFSVPIQTKILSKVYDYLYKKAVELSKRTNYCQFSIKNGKCSCFATKLDKNKDPLWCCAKCKHLGPEGCMVEALTCRAHYCGRGTDLFHSEENHINNNYLKAEKDLVRLHSFIVHFHFYGFRFTKEQSITQALQWLNRKQFKVN